MNKEYINKVIEFSGLSLKEFAEKIDVTVPTVRKWTKGIYEPSWVSEKAIRYRFKNETLRASAWCLSKNI